MFDMLTLDQLYVLHTSLHDTHTRIHERMMTGTRPLMPVDGDDWMILRATCEQVAETMFAVSAEIDRREELDRRSQAAVCRTCGFADCPGARTGDCPRWPARDDQARADA